MTVSQLLKSLSKLQLLRLEVFDDIKNDFLFAGVLFDDVGFDLFDRIKNGCMLFIKGGADFLERHLGDKLAADIHCYLAAF